MKKPNTSKLKKQDEELKKLGKPEKIDKNLTKEETFLKKLLKRFKKI